LVLASRGPQAYVHVRVVAYFADGRRETFETYTGQDGFANAQVPREPFRGLVVEADGMRSEIVSPNPVGVYGVVLRPPPVPAAAAFAPPEIPRRRWPFRKDPWLASFGARFGIHASDSLKGVPTQRGTALVGVELDASVLRFGRVSLAIGGVADLAPTSDYETHTYLGLRAGVVVSGWIGAVSVRLEGGEHTLSGIGRLPDPEASSLFDHETSGPVGGTMEVGLPYAGLELGGWLRLGHFAVGPRLTLREDIGRRRSVVVGNRWVEDSSCDDPYDSYYGGSSWDLPCVDWPTGSGHYEPEEMPFTAGGLSVAIAVMVGLDF
jgi:hypothetical protein